MREMASCGIFKFWQEIAKNRIIKIFINTLHFLEMIYENYEEI